MSIAGQTARHYVGLDGLRGFAALSVVLFHLDHWLNVPWLAPNAHFAVDLFFCLSGYVLPLAYGRASAADLPFAAFARIRLIRLMPIIVLAIAISGLYVAAKLGRQASPDLYAALAIAVALGLLVVPFFDPPHAIGGPQIFPLNGPEYSLFLEFVVNVAWFASRRVAQLPLALVLAAGSLALLLVYGSGGDVAATFWHGFPRVFATFFAGVALYHVSQGRGAALARSRAAGRLFWAACLAMAVLFFLPFSVGQIGWLAWVVVVAPVLVFTGAHVEIDGLARRLCMLTGALSYPIYALHYPIFCWLNGAVQTRTHRQMPGIEVPLAFLAIVAVSWIALRAYDEPLRAAFGRRFKRRAAPPLAVPTPT
ncbi:MAG: acyltransferase, partial [Caulobacteraceae bacterium]|nr:acyltransferase [Caulobacter sp.]